MLDKTELQKKIQEKYNQTSYKKRKENKQYCNICCKGVDKYWWSKHLETKGHLMRAEIQSQN